MRVELLVFEGCPHADATRLILGRVVSEMGTDLELTERVGDCASPTVLVNSVDVMTGKTEVPTTAACRLDVPTEVAIRAALQAAVAAGDTAIYPPQLAVGVTSSRIARVSPAGRVLHRAILRTFATTGTAPSPDELIAATPDGNDPRSLLDELYAHDMVRVDDEGTIRAAYPFSGVPTPHRVAIADGPTVYSMCAIDAIGIHRMLDQDTLITPPTHTPARLSP